VKTEDFGKVKVGDKLIKMEYDRSQDLTKPIVITVTELDVKGFAPTKKSGVIRTNWGLEQLAFLIRFDEKIYSKLLKMSKEIEERMAVTNKAKEALSELVWELQRK